MRHEKPCGGAWGAARTFNYMARSAAYSPEYLTIPQAARRFGLSPKTLRRLAREGEFPVYSLGTGWGHVRVTELETYFRSTRIRSTDHALARVEEVIDGEKQRAASP